MAKKIILILLFLFWALKCQGAILYFEPSKGEYSKDDVFLVELKINTEKERINAAQIELIFPPEKLEVVEISQGSSIFTLWPEPPSFSNEKGKISFVGGVPLGFEGEGKIISIAFKVISSEKEISFAEINFSKDSQVLLNDGRGTKTKFQGQKSIFTLLSKRKGVPKNEWEEKLKEDKIPPEPFQIILGKEPLIFEGKYFIAFHTIDLQTGIDHYEVKEGKRPWEIAQSPYLLKDQTLSSKILVKAVDKAGNERIAELLPPFPKKPFYKRIQFWLILFVLILAAIIIIVYFTQKRKKKLNLRIESSKM